ncbi:MAG: hypothetical protein ACLGIR_06740 [Actinomycetes bacterium]
MSDDRKDIRENDTTAWILVAMFVIVFISFVAAIYGLAVYDGW